MKSKIGNFFLGAGAPVASIGIVGCTGACGTCQYACTPGVFMILIIVSKFCCKKLRNYF